MLIKKLNLKSLATVALLGITALIVGCGGGGAKTPSCRDNNSCATSAPPLVVNPTAVNVYSNTPAALTINSGVAPFQVFSQDATVLPVTQSLSGAVITLVANNVAVEQNVALTILDALGQTANVAVTVKPSPILGALSVTPLTGSTCGAAGEGGTEGGGPVLSGSPICSGETATVAMTVKGANALPILNRQIRYDVLQGPYNFVIGQNGTVLAKTVTINTDQNGQAIVAIKIDPSTGTQVALLRATDLQSGNRVDTSFTIVQATNGTAILSVQPATSTVTGYYVDECGAGSYTYTIYGGTPPYTVLNTLPTQFTLSTGSSSGQTIVVPTSGGSFAAKALGGPCGGSSMALFTITDATGRVITANMTSVQGSIARPAPPEPVPLIALPPQLSNVCSSGTEFRFTIQGGTSPYNVSIDQLANVATVTSSGTSGTVRITSLTTLASGTTMTVTIFDAKSASTSTRINCI